MNKTPTAPITIDIYAGLYNVGETPIIMSVHPVGYFVTGKHGGGIRAKNYPDETWRPNLYPVTPFYTPKILLRKYEVW